MHPSAAAAATKPDLITTLRQNARKCDPTALRHFVPDGPITALLEIDHDGNILLLGAHTATPSDIRRCETVGKSPATSPDDAAAGTPDFTLAAARQGEPHLRREMGVYFLTHWPLGTAIRLVLGPLPRPGGECPRL
jgi:hypothetical protein